MSGKLKTLLLILAVMFCVANMANAQPGGPDGPGPKGGPGYHGGPPPFTMPGVPPEKCQAVDKILKELPARLFPLEQELKVRTAKLEALVVDPTSDDAAINAGLDEIAKVRAAIFKVRVDARRQVLKETGILLPPLKRHPGPGPMPGPGHAFPN
ncbi:MAG: periplasmic heavy metal sensor [Desulfovibrio sp.]|nr:periplasmic heavy metal sensor [Desulfovibrio sp.]